MAVGAGVEDAGQPEHWDRPQHGHDVDAASNRQVVFAHPSPRGKPVSDSTSHGIEVVQR